MVRLPYIKRERVGGVEYIYIRKGSKPRIRLNAPEGSAEFFAEYTAALEALSPVEQREAAGTWRHVASNYYAWHGFTGLHTSTQRVRRNVLEQFMSRIGRDRLADATPEFIIRLVDEKADRGAPEAAKTRLKAIRSLLDYAVSRGHVQVNVARDPKVAAAKQLIRSRPGGHRTWSQDDIAAYYARWRLGTREHLLMSLLLYTGCRISDAAILGPVHERDGWLVWNETKGRERYGKPPTAVPIAQPLRASIDAAPSGRLYYLCYGDGRPFSVKSLGQFFVKKCKAAKLEPGLSAHGVRKAAATIAAENGATENELMAMFGWKSPKQAAVYTRDVDRPRLAARAAKLVRVQNGLAKGRTPG